MDINFRSLPIQGSCAHSLGQKRIKLYFFVQYVNQQFALPGHVYADGVVWEICIFFWCALFIFFFNFSQNQGPLPSHHTIRKSELGALKRTQCPPQVWHTSRQAVSKGVARLDNCSQLGHFLFLIFAAPLLYDCFEADDTPVELLPIPTSPHLRCSKSQTPYGATGRIMGGGAIF